MQRMVVEVQLPDVLFDELKTACKECGMTVTKFATESVEVVLAGRRLEKLPPPPVNSAPRVPGTER